MNQGICVFTENFRKYAYFLVSQIPCNIYTGVKIHYQRPGWSAPRDEIYKYLGQYYLIGLYKNLITNIEKYKQNLNIVTTDLFFGNNLMSSLATAVYADCDQLVN